MGRSAGIQTHILPIRMRSEPGKRRTRPAKCYLTPALTLRREELIDAADAIDLLGEWMEANMGRISRWRWGQTLSHQSDAASNSQGRFDPVGTQLHNGRKAAL